MRMAMLMSFTSVIRVGRSLMRTAILMSFTSVIRVGRSYNVKVLCTTIVPFLFDASVRSLPKCACAGQMGWVIFKGHF